MEVEELVAQAGGVASAKALRTILGHHGLRRAVTAGRVVRVRRGAYVLPGCSEPDAAVQRVGGVANLLTAARFYGWPLKWPPTRPQVAVPLGRRVPPTLRRTVDVRWRDIPAVHIVVPGVTSPAWTVFDCATVLPLDQALTVADSALRSGDVDCDDLWALLGDYPGKWRGKVSRVLDLATPHSTGPFESVLRCLCLDVQGLTVRPQLNVRDHLGWVGRGDLVDTELRIVVEAESVEFHSGRDAFERDVRRYTRMAVGGWLVVRFTWREVMFEPDLVRAVLRDAVRLQRSRLGGLPG